MQEQGRVEHLFYKIINKYINDTPQTQFVVLYSPYSEFNSHIKFKVLHGVLSNLFINPKMKSTLLDLFCKSQKIYHIISRFSHKYLYKKAKIRINTDLYLNPISSTDKKTVSLFEKPTRSIFLFTCNDLIHMLMSGLTHCDHFFVQPQICKNPYNNLPFQRASLFQIYFAIKEKCMFVPSLLDAFFQCDFNLELFTMNYEQDIRNFAAKHHVKHSSIDTLYSEIFHMFRDTGSKIKIDPDFPKDDLVSIMRPYLYLYMMFMYSVNGSAQLQMYNVILRKKLYDFFVFNPLFSYKKQDNTFNHCYPPFTLENIMSIIRSQEYMSWYSYYWETSSIAPLLNRIHVYSHSLITPSHNVEEEEEEEEEDSSDDESDEDESEIEDDVNEDIDE